MSKVGRDPLYSGLPFPLLIAAALHVRAEHELEEVYKNMELRRYYKEQSISSEQFDKLDKRFERIEVARNGDIYITNCRSSESDWLGKNKALEKYISSRIDEEAGYEG